MIITPATWPSQRNLLAKTPTALLHLVGWYGSTHTAAVWRKAPEFVDVFHEQEVPGFDPQIAIWEPAFAQVEAEVMATASVILIRLENKGLRNGSLGSIAETGLALTSAALRGQAVIVSLEANLLASLNEPSAIAQYLILEMFLAEFEANPTLGGLLQLHHGDNLAELAQLACQTAQQQMSAALSGWSYDDFLAARKKRRQKYPRQVLLGGSRRPYAEVHQAVFAQKIKRLAQAYSGEAFRLKILAEESIAEAWNLPYGQAEPMATSLSLRPVLSQELAHKKAADQVVIAIMAEAASKAASTEPGFFLLHALTTGQEIAIFLEPFDPVDFLACHFQLVHLEPEGDEAARRSALSQAGVPAVILAGARPHEIEQAYNLLGAFKQNQLPAYKQVRQTLLGQTPAFQNADNIQRVRALVQAHLERLHQDNRYPDFFAFSTRI